LRDEPFRDRLLGTFAPFSRASLRPMAIACFRLVTFAPDPLLSVPRLRRRIADSTFFDADFPYFAISLPPIAYFNGSVAFAGSMSPGGAPRGRRW
jgi:hypothetical protein